MSSPTSFGSGSGLPRNPWQDRLQEHCRLAHMNLPVYDIFSDRRGGRTAWSCAVTVEGQKVTGRFWFDGDNLNNAREDAAEVALQILRVVPAPSSPQGSRRPQFGMSP